MSSYNNEDLNIKICTNKKGQNEIFDYRDRFFHQIFLGNKEERFKLFYSLLKQDFQKESIGFTFFCSEKENLNKLISLAKINNREIICLDEETLNIYFNPLKGIDEVIIENISYCFRDFYKNKISNSDINKNDLLLRNILKLLKRVKKDDSYFKDIEKLLIDEIYLLEMLNNLKNIEITNETFNVYRFYQEEDFEFQKQEYLRSNEEVINYFNNKDNYKDLIHFKEYIQLFIKNDFTKNLFHNKSTYELNFDDLLNSNKIVLINCNNHLIEDIKSTFINLLVSNFHSAIFNRDGNELTRNPHYSYYEDINSVKIATLSDMLTQGRGYRVSTTIMMDSIENLNDIEENFKQLIITNVRSKFFVKGIDEKTYNTYKALIEETYSQIENIPKTKSLLNLFKKKIKEPCLTKEDFLNLEENEFIIFRLNKHCMDNAKKYCLDK